MKIKWVIAGLWLEGLFFLGSAGENEFGFSSQSLSIPERGTVTAYVVRLQTNRFVFLPPLGWKAQYDVGEQTVTLQSRDQASRIALTIHLTDSSTNEPPSVERWRQWIQENQPEVRLLAEQPCYAREMKGWAFDGEHITARNIKLRHRWAFISGDQVHIEFHLTCPGAAFKEHEFAFGNLLTSFHWEKTGPAR
jgi:hypothetical protein